MSFPFNLQSSHKTPIGKCGVSTQDPIPANVDQNNKASDIVTYRKSFSFPSSPNILIEFLQSVPNPIISVNASGTILAMNKASETFFGYTTKDVKSSHICRLFDTEFHFDKEIERVRQKGPRNWIVAKERDGIRVQKKCGLAVPVEVQICECALDMPPLYLLYIKDISQEIKQSQRIAELEREISYLARHSLLGELATTITHELAQPLTAITNYTAAARRCWSTAPSEEAQTGMELVGKAGEQAKRAWLIMHRLRKLLQHRDAEFALDDLRLALEDAFELATIGAQQHDIAILRETSDQPVMVRMDRVQIQILLANLIRNAIDELRVFKGDRRLWIGLHICPEDPTMAEVRVEDTGPGIAPDVFENIFEPFLTTKPQGLGVGLAVSRRIAQAHRGRLIAENRPGGGAAFSFRIPLSQ